MLACPECGESNPEGARFCQACGARLGEAGPQVRKTITALFCDLVGSTPLAESLRDPEAFHDVVTRYLEAMTEVIERHGGTVEKFAGDAILGTFGVPRSHEDDALRTVRAAVEMREALSSLNVELQGRWDVTLQIKIGINSGEVLTGDSVAGQAMALGDPVNVAARLQDSAEPGDIILGQRTVRLAGAAINVEGPRSLPLKGKSERVDAYRLVGLKPEAVPAAQRFARPMVGRERELQSLRDAYGRVVRDEKGEVLVVVGPPGIGKSRLVAAFVSEVVDEATVRSTACPSYGERATFWPLAQIVRGQGGVTESDDAATVESKLVQAVNAAVEDRGEQAWIAARIVSLAGIAASEEGVPEAESLSAWRGFLEAVAASRPIVLVVEDLYWAGDSLLDFLGSLAGRDARILVIGTARPDLDETRLSRTAATVLRLDPLTSEEIGDLVDGLDATGLSAGLREGVIARCGGNALFAEALVAMIAERGLEEIDSAEVPDTVEALVAARLDALPSPLRSLVLDAAVVGSSIHTEALAAMSGVDPPLVAERMDDLVRREFLRPAEAPNEFEFWHGLVREVAYGQIPRAARSAKHRAFGSWLEGQQGDEAADLLAHHFGRAFELAVEAREPQEIRRELAERSFRYWVLAAGRALRAADPGAAAGQLASAAQALREIPEPDREAVGEAGGLLVTLGKWGEAVDLLTPFADSARPPILRALGVAMCKLYRGDPHGAEYLSGQAYLEQAAADGDVDAMASLAGTWKGIDDGKVRELYRRASGIDPSDPYPLGNLLEYEIQAAGDLSPVDGIRDQIGWAMERCEEQAAAGRNLPWAHYDSGKFRLLLGMPYDALQAYAKAVDLSPAAFMVETSLASLRRLSEAADIPGVAWSHDLLTLGLRAKFAEAAKGPIWPPVVVLAGGTSPEEEERIRGYAPVILEAFRGFAGTVISGGTVAGVSGLAGELGARYPDDVRTIGYAPRSIPAGAETDDRYHEVRRTEADSFSPLEPLTYWDDLFGRGIRPTQVRMIGVGGGGVAAAEYAIALALGATLGAIGGSGGVADEILADPHWPSTKRLTPLTPDADAIKGFIAGRP